MARYPLVLYICNASLRSCQFIALIKHFHSHDVGKRFADIILEKKMFRTVKSYSRILFQFIYDYQSYQKSSLLCKWNSRSSGSSQLQREKKAMKHKFIREFNVCLPLILKLGWKELSLFSVLKHSKPLARLACWTLTLSD